MISIVQLIKQKNDKWQIVKRIHKGEIGTRLVNIWFVDRNNYQDSKCHKPRTRTLNYKHKKLNKLETRLRHVHVHVATLRGRRDIRLAIITRHVPEAVHPRVVEGLAHGVSVLDFDLHQSDSIWQEIEICTNNFEKSTWTRMKLFKKKSDSDHRWEKCKFTQRRAP